jgi:hypothetical protein
VDDLLADRSPSGTEVKNAWSYTCTSSYFFMACCLIKQKDSFTFTGYLVHFSFDRAITILRHKSRSPCSIIPPVQDLFSGRGIKTYLKAFLALHNHFSKNNFDGMEK